MNSKTTKENLNIKEMATSNNLFQSKKSLIMFDTPLQSEYESDNNIRKLKRSTSEINRLKFLNMKSLKLSKRNTVNSIDIEKEEKLQKINISNSPKEMFQNNPNQLKNSNREGTINLISEIGQENKSHNSPANSRKSPSIFFKDNILLNGADLANFRKFSLSSVNNINSNEGDMDNSKYLDLKINENDSVEILYNKENLNHKNEKSKNFKSTHQDVPKSGQEYELNNSDKRESCHYTERKPAVSLTNVSQSPRKNSKKIANAEFNNYIRDLLAKSDENLSEALPNELKFISDIHKHENRLVDDVEISSLFNKYQVSHFLITIFTILGMASGILYYEMKHDKYLQLKSIDYALDTCLIVCSIANFLFIISSILRYLLYIKLKKGLVDYSKQKNLWNTYLWVPLMFEIIMSICQPNIFCKNIYFITNINWYLLEVEYCVNDYLMIMLLLKIYVIFRSVISISDFLGERADRVMKMFGGDSSILFAVKCLLQVNPFFNIFFFFISTVLILAYLMKIIEGPVFLVDYESQANLNDFRSFNNCIWYTFITMVTVGFGDYFPKTNFGRLVGVFDAIIGTVFVSLFIIYLQRALSLNPTEKTAVNFLDRLKYKEMIKNKASFYFLNSYRYNKAKNKYLNELKNPNRNEKKIKYFKKEVEATFYEKTAFNKMFKRLIQNIYELPNDYDLMDTKIKDTEKKIEMLKTQGSNLKSSLDEISYLIENSKKPKEKE